MNEPQIRFESIPWRRIFPWLHLTRAFWIAIDLRKLLLAAVGLLLTSLGWLVIDQLPFGQPVPSPDVQGLWPWQWNLGYELPSRNVDLPGSALSEFRGVLDHPGVTLIQSLSNWQIVLHPLRSISEPCARLFRGSSTWAEIADAITRLLWGLIVWSVFGGAIGRIAAVQFAREQQVGIRAALRFSLSRFFGYLSAPLLPLSGVAVFWGLCVIGGWLGRIPGDVGDAILGALWGLELVFGLIMAVILIGVAAGWPLMFATIGVEGTDGFDGLSRMYNYVFERPLYYLWQTGLALLFGSACTFFVWLMTQLLVHLAIWGVSWGHGYAETIVLVAGSPPITTGGQYSSPLRDIDPSVAIGAQLIRAWMCVLATLVMGFVYSYFWTSATIIYFTLRRSVDANDVDEVYLEDEAEEDELLPLVGAAAMGSTATLEPPPAEPPGMSPPVDLTP